MPRRPSYSSYSLYLQTRENDKCCTGGGSGTSGNTSIDIVSNNAFVNLETRVSILELSFNDIHIIDNCINVIDTSVNNISNIHSSINILDICMTTMNELIHKVANNAYNELIYLNGVFATQANYIHELIKQIQDLSSYIYQITINY